MNTINKYLFIIAITVALGADYRNTELISVHPLSPDADFRIR